MRHPLHVVLPLVAVLLLLGLDHGLPHRYVPDDSVVKCALGMARDAGGGELGLAQALVPPSGKYTTYPYLLPYLSLGAVGARYVVGRITGEWGGAGEFAESVFDDPTPAWFAVRLLFALITLALPWAVYRAARELDRDRAEAGVAALLAGTSLLVVQYAHTTRPWAPMVTFGALALTFTLRLRRRRDGRAAAGAFGFAALAGASHPAGLAALGIPVLGALLFRLRPSVTITGLVLSLALLLGLGFPYLVVHGEDTGQGVIESADEAGVQIGGQAFDPTAFGGRHAAKTARSWLGYEPVLVLAGFVGLWRLRRRDGRAWWLLGPPAAAFAVAFLLYDGTHVRYLMPTTPFLALGAAAALREAARRVPGRAPKLLLAAVVALPLVQAARLDVLLSRTDTRTLAVELALAASSEDDVLAVDGFGSYYGPPLTPSSASLLAVMDKVPLNRSEQRILQRADAGLPEPETARHVFPVGRFYRFDSYYPTDYLQPDAPRDLQSVFEEWSVTVYVQVDRLPDEARRQPITDMLAWWGELVGELSPTGRRAPALAELPTDMAFPLTDLWTYERPGPWIRVWRIRR